MNFKDKVAKGYDNLTEAEKRVVSCLPSGKEHAMTARELERFTGLAQKDLSAVARRALDAGFPVLACQHGFYIATCDSEVSEYKRREELRDLEHSKTIAAAARFLGDRTDENTGRNSSHSPY